MFASMEEEVLTYWRDNDIFNKSLNPNNPPFILMEGPPTANGKPGIHHVLTRTFKDIVARSKTMAGYYVQRKAGWDEHGLPVEIEVQKALALKSKGSIVDYGVKSFNEACKNSVNKYVAEWEALTTRMGYWLNFKEAYHTSNDEYIHKVWEVVEKLSKLNLIYKDYKIVPWAWDSETTVSNSEVAQGYREVTDTSAYVKFKVVGQEKTYLVAWTTTPWTLPANQCLAISHGKYYLQRLNGELLISMEKFKDAEILDTIRYLNDYTYEHPFTGEIHPVITANFVREEKTGIVHIAPAFGEDDYNLWKNPERSYGYNIELFCNMEPLVHLNQDGLFNDKSILNGVHLKEGFNKANQIIIKYLTDYNLILKTEKYTHSYPHNWRTEKPLVYMMRSSVYVRVNKIRWQLLENNKLVNWFPEHIKDGRFGEWIRGNVDWSISRERFWGTPLPLNDECEFIELPGTHKPEATVNDVLDCWFDSGCVAYAAFDNQQADLICEAVDQTRGWFYTLAIIGTAINGKFPYKNALCLGHILDKNKQKMGKSKGNAVDPTDMFNKHGADTIRWYFAENPVGNSLVFNENDFKYVHSNVLNRFWNSYKLLKLYADIDKPDYHEVPLTNLMDQWLSRELDGLILKVRKNYDDYKIHVVCEDIKKFLENLSNVWIRANRERFWNTKGSVDHAAYYILHRSLTTLCKLMAPIVPFISEKVYLDLVGTSVHLEQLPEVPVIITDGTIFYKMHITQEVIKTALKIRSDNQIKVKQPLLAVYVPWDNIPEEFINYIKQELNVKSVIFESNCKIRLNLEISEELKVECVLREFLRAAQVLRKERGFHVSDRIRLYLDISDEFRPYLVNREEIAEKLLVNEFIDKNLDVIPVKIGDYEIKFDVEKL